MALLAMLDPSDRIFERLHGSRYLLAHPSTDDMLGQVVVWHIADAGLKTVRALVASLQQEALDSSLFEDLQALEVALEKAEAAAVRFSFVVRLGSDAHGVQNAELCQRKGSFW